jgi:nitrous-oxide reductase
MIPCPKSPHGCDTDPSGEYIVASGKLAATIPVFSFTKMQQAIANKTFEGEYEGIPVLKYDAVLYGEVKKPGLGPLHTEFDDKGFAYTSFFVSSEIVKWNVKTLVYRYLLLFYITSVPKDQPNHKICDRYNKITKDRICHRTRAFQSAQLYSIEGDKMKLLDFPTIGEPLC